MNWGLLVGILVVAILAYALGYFDGQLSGLEQAVEIIDDVFKEHENEQGNTK